MFSEFLRSVLPPPPQVNPAGYHLLDEVNDLLFCGGRHQPFVQVGDDVSADLAGQLAPEIRRQE